MLHQERDNLYEKAASFTIDSDDNDLEKHVLSIQEHALISKDLKHTVRQLSLTIEDRVFFIKLSIAQYIYRNNKLYVLSYWRKKRRQNKLHKV